MNTAASSRRPPADRRRFTSAAVEREITRVQAGIADPELAWLFGNCFPNTLDTTVFFERDADGSPDTYVITGDIEAMWLRDSTAQVWPYFPLASEDPALCAMLEGVIRRQARSVLLDPYANAFYKDPVLGRYRDDHTAMRPGVHERKWELDSLAAFFRLSTGYWRTLGDRAPFDARWLDAIRAVFALLRVEQGPASASPYVFQRTTRQAESLARHGTGDPSRPCGLVRCGFRPSDDPCKFPYLVPANAMMAAELGNLSDLLDTLGLPDLSEEAGSLASAIRSGLEAHGLAAHPLYGEIWSYEVDGYGGLHLMDDANIPSLLSLPYLGFCRRDDPRYLRTRAFCLGEDNPYYASHGEIDGIGGPHAMIGAIWPLSVIMRALTADNDEEILHCLGVLKATHAGTGFMHESFAPEDPARFTRPWFAWANTLFGELVVDLHRRRPDLLRRSLP